MKFSFKVLLLSLLIVADVWLMKDIKLHKIEWSSFLPKERGATARSQEYEREQYLFVHISTPAALEKLKKLYTLKHIVPIDKAKGSYMLLFSMKDMDEVLSAVASMQKSGTALVGDLLVGEIVKELGSYLYLVPIIVALLLLFVSLRLWIDLLLEMALYTLLLVAVLRIVFIEINAASLLSLVFLIVYSLTLINYLYSDGMNYKRLFFGIQVSIVATMVSALLLIDSHFGLVHSFGVMLLVGLVVLHLYMSVRIFLQYYIGKSTHKHRYDLAAFTKLPPLGKRALTLLGVGVFLLLLVRFDDLEIDLNILNTLPKNSDGLEKIEHFERSYNASLPLVIDVRLQKGNFDDVKMMHRLENLQSRIERVLGVRIIKSIPDAFAEFKKLAKQEASQADIYAQFLLGYSLMPGGVSLFSPDMSQSSFIAVVPLETTSSRMIELNRHLMELGAKYPQFQLSLQGKVADFERYLGMFVREFSTGLFATLALSALFFLFYCRSLFSVSMVFLSALFSLGWLVVMHLLFHKPLDMLTLTSIVLYGGLVADSLIQLFVCYKSEESCEQSVLYPIFVSNISILLFLFGMLFVGGVLASFAFDMGILLAANMVFVIWIVPILRRRFSTACSV